MASPLSSIEIIILAAGLGTRMRSDVPKVLHRVCGQSMLALLMVELDRVLGDQARFNVVVGHGREVVSKTVRELQDTGQIRTPVVFTVQDKQLGTGHAVKLALKHPQRGPALCAVFNGDLPLFTAECFTSFLAAHAKHRSSASLASTIIDDAGQYGRVLRKRGVFTGVVEYKDATIVQRRIKEYNGGVYLFERALLEKALGSAKCENAAGEFYLPDVFPIALKLKKRIFAHVFKDSTVLQGVNTMKELALAQGELYQRTSERHMMDGVFFHEPKHTYIGPRVKIGRGCVIGAFTSIQGDSVIGDRVQVGAHCDLNEVTIGAGSVIRHSTVAEKVTIGKDCAVGPMAHLRPGTKLHDNVRVGNFVEIKESEVGARTSAAHLSYIGDARIGKGVNLGCGFITCNYDGTIRDGNRKHRTVIGDEVFVGSDSQVVAPIEISSGSFIASGSTVTDSVKEKDSLVISRSRQVTKPGYARKYRQPKP